MIKSSNYRLTKTCKVSKYYFIFITYSLSSCVIIKQNTTVNINVFVLTENYILFLSSYNKLFFKILPLTPAH